MTCDTNDDSVWLMGEKAFHRLALKDGSEDLAVPRDGIETRFEAVPGGLVAWNFDEPGIRARAVLRTSNGTFAAGKWHSVGVLAGVVPLAGGHCLVLNASGDAFEANLALDSWTRVALRVAPAAPKPPDLSPEERADARRP